MNSNIVNSYVLEPSLAPPASGKGEGRSLRREGTKRPPGPSLRLLRLRPDASAQDGPPSNLFPRSVLIGVHLCSSVVPVPSLRTLPLCGGTESLSALSLSGFIDVHGWFQCQPLATCHSPLHLRPSLWLSGKREFCELSRIILIATPELEHGVTHRKQRKEVCSNRQQTHVFAESYQTVYFRIPTNRVGTPPLHSQPRRGQEDLSEILIANMDY
jgi:hypothetical protein